ncbi:MAG: polynucleotide adenylyltransferase PcnB [Treponema brennaborense]|nr:polynucleotide adenylyltransferase PcnB [Treponema brennaborense]
MLVRYSYDKNGRPVKKALVYTQNEHSIENTAIDHDALWIISQLRDNGFSAYIVGGAVRDLLLKKTPKDFDIVTDATPARLKKIFRNSRIIGRRFRLVHIFFGQKIFEASTFRSLADGTVGNSFGSIEEDVLRRDFTMNALYYDPQKCQIIDYVGGVRDIRAKIIRPIIPLNRMFIEDPVRMIRAVKYAASTGFKMPLRLRLKIRSGAHLLSSVSPSRLTEELMKIINSGHSFEIVRLALQTDIYMYLQPAATALMYADKNYERNYLRHLKEMDDLKNSEPNARTGRKLTYLIFDFVSGLTNWREEIESNSAAGDLYVKTWGQCRRFVLPMNPQKSELEFAIKDSLQKLGVPMKIPRVSSRKKLPTALRKKNSSEVR